MIKDLYFRSLITGYLSYIPGLYNTWDKLRPMGNTASASYCKGIWDFHKKNIIDSGGEIDKVGELGPGASLGVMIAALLDGASYGVGLDAGLYAGYKRSEAILEEFLNEAMFNNFDNVVLEIKNSLKLRASCKIRI